MKRNQEMKRKEKTKRRRNQMQHGNERLTTRKVRHRRKRKKIIWNPILFQRIAEGLYEVSDKLDCTTANKLDHLYYYSRGETTRCEGDQFIKMRSCRGVSSQVTPSSPTPTLPRPQQMLHRGSCNTGIAEAVTQRSCRGKIAGTINTAAMQGGPPL